MALDGDGQWELVDEVHRGAGDDGPTAEVLQAEHYRRGQTVGGGGKERSDHGEWRGLPSPQGSPTLDAHHSTPAASVLGALLWGLAGDGSFQPPWPFWQLWWDGAQVEGQGSTQPGPLWVSSRTGGLEATPFLLWGKVHSTASQHRGADRASCPVPSWNTRTPHRTSLASVAAKVSGKQQRRPSFPCNPEGRPERAAGGPVCFRFWWQPLTSVGPPNLLHAMPHEHDAGQLGEGLDDIEVAQRADLKEGHAILLCVGARLLCWNLPLEGQVQPVPNQDPGDPRRMLEGAQDSAEAQTWDTPPLGTVSQAPKQAGPSLSIPAIEGSGDTEPGPWGGSKQDLQGFLLGMGGHTPGKGDPEG